MSRHLPLSTKRLGSLLLTFFLTAISFLVFGLLLSSSQAQPSAPAGTYVPAFIITDTTWTIAGSPYYVTSDVEIQGATLTIEPGVRVTFMYKYYIHVRDGASIIAKGTPSQHITFARHARRWKKIWFHANTSSYFRYVDFSGAGAQSQDEDTTIQFDGPGTHVLNYCTVEDSELKGLYAHGSGLNLTVAGTVFQDNGQPSMLIDQGPNITVTGCTFNPIEDSNIDVRGNGTGPTVINVSNSDLANANRYAIRNRVPFVICVAAQGNWWGADDGPTGGGGGACWGMPGNTGSGSPAGGGVDYGNYLTSPPPLAGIETAPVATFTTSPDPGVTQPVGRMYTFGASGSTDVEDYTPSLSFCWNWEDDGSGCDAAGMTATHSFATGGVHTVRLVVADTDGLTDTVTQDVLVSWPPTATFTFTQTTWAEVEFDASASGDVETPQAQLLARWDWQGDGVWDTGVTSVTQIQTHTYLHLGRYWPTLVVEDADGVTSTHSLPVDVIPPAANGFISGSGGTLVSADGTVRVDLYTDTVAGEVISNGIVITLTPWLTLPYPLSEGDFAYQGFNLAATSQADGQPIDHIDGTYTITLTYDEDYLFGAAGLLPFEDKLRLYHWSGGSWDIVPYTLDTGADRLVATPDSFGDFVLAMDTERFYLPLVIKFD